MAYDRQQLRVDWIFRINGTDEIAMTGLSISGATDFDAGDALTAYDTATDGSDLNQAMLVMLGAGRYAWADYSTLTDVKVAALDVNGLYITEAKVFSPPSPGTGNGANIVPQCSVVLSLRSPTTLGRANYGRMYIPHSMMLLAAGTATATTIRAQGCADDSATFLNTVNNTFNVGPNPGVIQIMSNLGTGLSKGVTRCAVGTVNDTQRRRRNRLAELYSFSPVLP